MNKMAKDSTFVGSFWLHILLVDKNCFKSTSKVSGKNLRWCLGKNSFRILKM